jgi:hypothetical protein
MMAEHHSINGFDPKTERRSTSLLFFQTFCKMKMGIKTGRQKYRKHI